MTSQLSSAVSDAATSLSCGKTRRVMRLNWAAPLQTLQLMYDTGKLRRLVRLNWAAPLQTLQQLEERNVELEVQRSQLGSAASDAATGGLDDFLA